MNTKVSSRSYAFAKRALTGKIAAKSKQIVPELSRGRSWAKMADLRSVTRLLDCLDFAGASAGILSHILVPN
jgi:hypothetical protein